MSKQLDRCQNSKFTNLHRQNHEIDKNPVFDQIIRRRNCGELVVPLIPCSLPALRYKMYDLFSGGYSDGINVDGQCFDFLLSKFLSISAYFFFFSKTGMFRKGVIERRNKPTRLVISD